MHTFFDMILILIVILHWSTGSMVPPSQCCFLEEELIEHKLLPIKEMIFNWFFWGDFSSARQGNSRGLIESTAWPSLLISSRFPIATHDWCFGWYGAVYKCTNVLAWRLVSVSWELRWSNFCCENRSTHPVNPICLGLLPHIQEPAGGSPVRYRPF